jgi:hypothetical protein
MDLMQYLSDDRVAYPLVVGASLVAWAAIDGLSAYSFNKKIRRLENDSGAEAVVEYLKDPMKAPAHSMGFMHRRAIENAHRKYGLR